jgi:formylglycine-generating enzyme required for sulfatase activity
MIALFMLSATGANAQSKLRYTDCAGNSTVIDAYTTAERNNLSNVTNGTKIFNTTTQKVEIWTGTKWVGLPPDAPTANNQTFCSSANPVVSDLVATGDFGNIKWYDTESGVTALDANAPLPTGTYTYYVSQSFNSNESVRAAVEVTVIAGNCAIPTPSPSLACGITASNEDKTFTATADPKAFGYEFFVNNVSQGLQSSNIKTFDAAKTDVTVKYYYPPAFLKPKMVDVEGTTSAWYYGSSHSTTNVDISGFKMSETEVTQAQYEYVMGDNPSSFRCGGDEDNSVSDRPTSALPVENITWYHAITYCNKLSILENKEPCYTVSGVDFSGTVNVPTSSNSNWNAAICNFSKKGYRLPTRSEWEYAARGGVNKRTYTYSGSNNVCQVAWYAGNNGSSTTCGAASNISGTKPVKQKLGNDLGLYDMSGNVWELIWSGRSDPFPSATPNTTSTTSGNRVFLGGTYLFNASTSSVFSMQESSSLYVRARDIGIRVVTSQ